MSRTSQQRTGRIGSELFVREFEDLMKLGREEQRDGESIQTDSESKWIHFGQRKSKEYRTLYFLNRELRRRGPASRDRTKLIA